MEEKYWNRFMETGKITDYLFYRGMQLCDCVQKEQNRKGEKANESDYGDGYGARADVNWRV